MSGSSPALNAYRAAATSPPIIRAGPQTGSRRVFETTILLAPFIAVSRAMAFGIGQQTAMKS